MYANLDEDFLAKTKDKAKEQAVSEMGKENAKDCLIYSELKDDFDEISFEDESINVTVSNNLGSFTFEIPLNSAAFEEILSIVIRKMNKIKSMLESLK
jgi:hypothetical protein